MLTLQRGQPMALSLLTSNQRLTLWTQLSGLRYLISTCSACMNSASFQATTSSFSTTAESQKVGSGERVKHRCDNLSISSTGLL